MVGEGVAVFNAGTHHLFGYKAEGLHAVDDIVERATLAEADVAAGADGGHGAVVVGVLNDVHLAEIVGAFVHAEQFGFDEGKAAVAPASAGTVLVFDRGDGQLFHNGELVAFVLFLFLFGLCKNGGAHGDNAEE